MYVKTVSADVGFPKGWISLITVTRIIIAAEYHLFKTGDKVTLSVNCQITLHNQTSTISNFETSKFETETCARVLARRTTARLSVSGGKEGGTRRWGLHSQNRVAGQARGAVGSAHSCEHLAAGLFSSTCTAPAHSKMHQVHMPTFRSN